MNNSKKIIHGDDFLGELINSICAYQTNHLISDDELSRKVWLSPTVIGKIKSWSTNPSYATLRKLKKWWIQVPMLQFQNSMYQLWLNNHEPP